MSADLARRDLILLLQRAHSGERAAWHAYHGHARAVWSARERGEIEEIKDSEWVHRECVAAMLADLGGAPTGWRETLMLMIGATIAFLCRLGALAGPFGWYAAMDGAGRLEASNVHEYVTAARHARAAGREDLVPELIHMAEVEWEHELYFYERCQSHWLRRIAPGWQRPALPILEPAAESPPEPAAEAAGEPGAEAAAG